MKRGLTLIAACSIAPTLAFGDIMTVEAEGSVSAVMDRLESAVDEAGATVFARVDHGAGAEAAGLELQDAQLLIFGNPQLGTQAMQDDIRAGLQLPLRMLVYGDDSGIAQIAWQMPADMFDGLDIDEDAEYVGRMEDALTKFAEAAAGK
ncbi:DUF302 domain-containing protein [uncultured Jannaschia sp.]|uniref:DUF302 domain-containing protein n=1 Tax=uncultured Jannaschia sp. TaxID=293347 RepID=UPI00262ECC9E|nr:DUF302 domain-containing protein [uncultured Jannaschia sp.]